MPQSSYDPPGDASSAVRLARLRERDPERFFLALFAPPEHRAALCALYAYAAEIARAGQVSREPMVALLRLAWWRETIAGAPRAHEVAIPLASALAAGALVASNLTAIADAEEARIDDALPDLPAWRAWLHGTAGGVAVAAGRLLGAPDPEALRPLGAADGAARVLRATAALAEAGHCLLPHAALDAHGLRAEDLSGPGRVTERAALHRALAGAALGWLPVWMPRVDRAALAAVLVVVPARYALRRLSRDGVAPAFGTAARLAVLGSWARGGVGP